MSWSSLYNVLALATSMARPDHVGHQHPVDVVSKRVEMVLWNLTLETIIASLRTHFTELMT